MVRWTSAFLLFAVATIATSGSAAARAKHATIVFDANTGRTLQASAANAKRYPASLVKMMTIYMAFEEIKNGRLKFSTPIVMSKNASRRPPSKLGLKPGQRITVRTAIRALVTKSANDVAAALAEHIGGSEQNFAAMMTRKARQLGMRNTVFKNASGLPNRAQFTTARDMVRLALALQEHHPKYYPMFRRRVFHFRHRRYRNHNRLLGRVAGVDGIKTGYTRASGFNLVTNVRRGRKHIVAVVMGQSSGRKRNALMHRLIRAGLIKASTRRTRRRLAPRQMLLAKQRRTPSTRTRAAPRPRLVSAPRMLPRPRAAPAPRLVSPPKFARATMRPTMRPSIVRTAPTPLIKSAKVRTFSVFVPRQQTRETDRTPDARRSTHQTSAPMARARDPIADHLRRTGLARPPSTFAEQAAALQNTSTPASRFAYSSGRRLAGQARLANYEIQVGAFGSEDEARRHLNDVRVRAGSLLRGTVGRSRKARVRSRSIYRARFAGFDARSARSTCQSLRQASITCFVSRE